jgi:hypothetical protein
MQKLYKDINGEIFAYVSEEDKKKYGLKSLRPLTDSEVNAYEEGRKSPTVAELEELVWRNSQLQIADYELNKVQDSDPKAVGTVGEWRMYRKELRGWPENSKFPNKESRPISPHIKE